MARNRKRKLHRGIKERLGYDADMPDAAFLRDWNQRKKRVCKPCWELRYCPYGPVVEDYPLLPPLRADAVVHNAYLRECLETGRCGDGKRLDSKRRRHFRSSVESFDEQEYPEEIPESIAEMQCTVFGHVCPVIFSAEACTETSARRRTGRYIPFQTKIRVVRRDNYTCQHCGVHLKDDEVEFDHVIPVAKGGSSEEHNIRLTCHKCNRDKSDRVQI